MKTSFEQLLVEQLAWISDLTKFATFATDQRKYDKLETTINDVLKAHDKDGYLIAVSDGLVKHMYQMSFGWVLSTAGGLHLEKSYGGCNGRGSLLRAEAIGMLSISIFIALMAKHRKRTDLKIKYVSDNLELINKSKEHLNYTNPYPNNKLSAEFDTTEQIYLTNETYKVEASFQHVYGHQDTKSREKTSVETVLNVEAYRLAENYQDELGAYSPITHVSIVTSSTRNQWNDNNK
mmetsp:Transcript_17495/g.17631  ORF Transcript_17495/g.17631 Transcript_17495/m.17631 type:complete len:235 (+) Transcript_17495:1-705(+)